MMTIKVTLATMNERLNHLATKSNVAALWGEMRWVTGTLDGTLGVWQFLTVMGAGVALIIAWPKLSAAPGI